MPPCETAFVLFIDFRGRTSPEKGFVDLQETFVPEFIQIHNVFSYEKGRETSCQILNTITGYKSKSDRFELL